MAEPYRPSNGSEGEGFYEAWCSRCSRDAAFRENPDSGDGCPIAAATYVFNIDDPEYPKEWIEDEKGPRCTAFTTDPTMPTRCDKTPDMFFPCGNTFTPRRNKMKIWFDTEFIEDGKTIDLISIGMVREDGATFYAESAECDHERASPWVKENVLVHLQGGRFDWSRDEIAHTIVTFAGEKPEFWAYYADYDWVALCQLYGTMMDLPKGWPMYCRDVKQLCDDMGNPKLPKQDSAEHHALADAKWTKQAWEYLGMFGRTMASVALPPSESAKTS